MHTLINDPPQKSYRHQLGPMPHFLTTQKFDPLLYFQGSGLQTFPKLPVHALNHDPQKKKLQAPTRAHDLLF